MARMPSGEPRSVPDINDEDYDEMIRRQAANNARAAGEPVKQAGAGGRIGHPGELESLIPVWGSGREALADFEGGDYVGAGLNGALAASDLFLAGSLLRGAAKGRDVCGGQGDEASGTLRLGWKRPEMDGQEALPRALPAWSPLGSLAERGHRPLCPRRNQEPALEYQTDA